MSKRLLSLAALLLILAGGAHAAEKPKAVGQYVDLQPVAMPIVIDGQLVNYVFVYVRINLTSGADVIKLRDREPAFRDALIRDGHRTPFVVPGNWERIDEAKLAAALSRDAAVIAGPGALSSVVVTAQAPRKHMAPPRP
ncbi:MAG: hypothetical protein JWR47_3092 [Phenylobacterium sp.]|jgi:hypothetical protein|nr:hypothetical protein [Phenylobacterium sp.]MDB5436835.1 hypothetical protein [Phenylobacterium sp.]MDB5464049.1 hypothetical protein [Phenylobacterium sp.]